MELVGLIISIVAAIIAIVALIMAAPPFAQLVWGRPRIEVKFSLEDAAGSRILKCEVYNHPVGKKALLLLRVRREAIEDLNATMEIRESGSGQVMVPVMLPLINTHSGPPSQRTRLPGSIFSARFGIVAWIDEAKGVFPIEDLTRPSPSRKEPIPSGRFLAIVEILTSGEKRRSQRELLVGKARHELRWL